MNVSLQHKRQRVDTHLTRQTDQFAKEVDPPTTTQPSLVDAQLLRGIPVCGPGVSGTMARTRPDSLPWLPS